MAGYRKRQYQGSMFSNLDAAIEELRENPEALRIAQRLFCEHRAEHQEIPEALLTDIKAFRRVFVESYDDYKTCRADIKHIDHQSNQGVITRPNEALRELVDKYREVLKARPAWFCAAVAYVWAWENRSLDGTNEYAFKDHVPVVRKLEGGQLLLHEMLIDKLLAFC